MSRLVVVESPTKARTISAFLPDDYIVEACMGHVRDLPPSAKEIPAEYKDKPWARIGVDVTNNFAPLYIVPSEKKKVIKLLKDKLKSADELVLATDEDREGESIGWHLIEVLNPKVPIKRMVFHEITREAIAEALKNTRTIDEELVRAQETRRILDRLVGYTVSPLLWKKISPGLSAGRVQSVAVNILVEREYRRLAFVASTYWDLKASLRAYKQAFTATLITVDGQRVATGKDFDENTGELKSRTKALLLDEESAQALRKKLKDGDWSVINVEERMQNRRPAPPFTTSTLQQEANRKLRLSAKETMRIAQRLYEEGYITYMRTDSVNLSNEAITAARASVEQRYGKDFLSETPRRYTTKSKSAQEAHEAIRPAGNQMQTADEHGLKGVDAAVYDMIWKRTIATQMADAVLRFITASIQVENAVFEASGKQIVFPGFFRAYVEGSDDPDASLDDQESLLPPLKVGDDVDCLNLEALGHETKPPNRYTEASLVQTLEREGVGRPSTYATIISTIQDRGYVVKNGTSLVPTFIAFAVTRLLQDHFADLVDTQFTARMEEVLDEIAAGQADWLPYLNEFYGGETGLETRVQEKTETLDPRDFYALSLEDAHAKVRIGRYGPYIERENGEGVVRASIPLSIAPADLDINTVERLLRQKDAGPDSIGTDPETGLPVYILEGPYGLYAQLGEVTEDNKKPKRVSLPKGTDLETISLVQVLGLLNLPRTLGNDPESGEEIQAGLGRFGPYVRRGELFKSLTKHDDVLTVDLERALELLVQAQSKVLRELGQHPTDGSSITINRGRFGPYIKYKRENISLAKTVNIETLTLEDALQIIAEKGGSSKKGTSKKKTTRSKSTKSTQSASEKKTTKAKATRKTKTTAKAKTPKKTKAKPSSNKDEGA